MATQDSDARSVVRAFICGLYESHLNSYKELKSRISFMFMIRSILSTLLIYLFAYSVLKDSLAVINTELKLIAVFLVMSYAFIFYFDFIQKKYGKKIAGMMKITESEKAFDLNHLNSISSDSISVLLRISNLRKVETLKEFKQEILEAANIPEIKQFKFFKDLIEYARLN